MYRIRKFVEEYISLPTAIFGKGEFFILRGSCESMIEAGIDDISSDTDRQLIYKYIYTLKDLRNAIAHNSVVFDTRVSIR